MRRPILLLSLTIGLAAAGGAQAQLSKPHRDPFVKVYPKPTPIPPPRKPTPLISLAPPPRLALTGLPVSGDGGAGCRRQCSVARYSCDVSGDDQCGVRWTRCLATCSTTASARPR